MILSYKNFNLLYRDCSSLTSHLILKNQFKKEIGDVTLQQHPFTASALITYPST